MSSLANKRGILATELICALAVASCVMTKPAIHSQQSSLSTALATEQTVQVKSLDYIKEQTLEQKQQANKAGAAYFQALRDTILDIDDQNTSPEVIAKTAISKNLGLLRKKVEAQTIHIKESSWIGADVTSEQLEKLPTSRDVDAAVYMVLKLRQQHIPNSQHHPPSESPSPRKSSPTVHQASQSSLSRAGIAIEVFMTFLDDDHSPVLDASEIPLEFTLPAVAAA